LLLLYEKYGFGMNQSYGKQQPAIFVNNIDSDVC